MYNPANWYWIVGTNTTQAWSSARMQYIPISTDTDYISWSHEGNTATYIDNATDLADVIINQALPVISAQNGLQVACTSNGALSGTYAIDSASLGTITSLSDGITAGKPLPSGGTTFNYYDMLGGAHAFSGPEFQNFAAAVESYVYNMQEAIKSMIGGSATLLPPTQPVTFE